MNDTIKKGTVAGLFGSIGDALIHWPAYFILGTSTTAHYISQLIFPFKDVNTVRLMYGLTIHLVAGSLVGVALALIFRNFGSDFPYYKGLGLGITMWLVHIAVIPNIVAPRPFLYRTELEALVDFLAHAAYGLVATYSLGRSFLREVKSI